MSAAHPSHRRTRLAAVAALVVALVAGCSHRGWSVGRSRPRTRRPSRSRRARRPNRASARRRWSSGSATSRASSSPSSTSPQQNGYYADAGLDVEFQNKIDPDLITLVGQGSIDVGIGDGTSVIPAVSNGIPVAYVATIYGKFPNIVFAKASSGITTAADLKGKKVGIPGRYGSGWIMLQALLKSAGPDDRRHRDRRVPRFHPGGRRRAGRGRCRDGLRQQRAGPARAAR